MQKQPGLASSKMYLWSNSLLIKRYFTLFRKSRNKNPSEIIVRSPFPLPLVDKAVVFSCSLLCSPLQMESLLAYRLDQHWTVMNWSAWGNTMQRVAQWSPCQIHNLAVLCLIPVLATSWVCFLVVPSSKPWSGFWIEAGCLLQLGILILLWYINLYLCGVPVNSS